VEEARQKQAQELVDVQHVTELEEMDELEPTASSKGTIAIEDEDEPVTEEEPTKEEESVSDILPFGLCVTESETAQHASKSQEPDTEPDAPDDDEDDEDDDEEVDQLADDDDDDYKQDEELKTLSAVVPPMKTIKAVRERKVVDENESDDYGSRRRSGRGVKRRRLSTPQAINETDLRRSGRAKRQKTDDVPNMLAFIYGESGPEEDVQENPDASLPLPAVSEAGSTTIVAEQLAAASLDGRPPQQEPTIPATPEDGLPSPPAVATDTKKGKGGRKSNARFWVYAEVDEDALPKDLPDPDALMRKRRKSLAGEKKAKKQVEEEVNGRASPETNGHNRHIARRGRGRGWRGGRGGGRGGQQKPGETDDDVSVTAPVPMSETS
jgi:hypothetical protein